MYELRDYQRIAVDSAIQHIKSNTKKKMILVAPTGAGKSLYIANIIRESGLKTIVLQPNVELLQQNMDKYISYGNSASVYCSSLKMKVLSDVTFATIGSLIGVLDDVKKYGFELILVDEAHYMSKKNSQMDKLLKHTKIDNVIGLTATPIELRQTMSGPDLVMINRSQKNLFDYIGDVTQIDHLVRCGFWSEIKYDIYDTDSKYLKLNTSGTEFTESSVRKYYSANHLSDKIVLLIQQSDRKHHLVFVPTIDDAKSLAKLIPNSRAVYSGMDKNERLDTITKFKSGEVSTVINCNILSIGFDFPELDHIIMAKATNSFAVYYQQLGRGVRIHKDKENVLVSDFSKNIERFGKVEDILFLRDETGKWNMFNGERQLTHTNTWSRPETENYDGTFIFGDNKGRKLNDRRISKQLLEWVVNKYKPIDKRGELFRNACKFELENRLNK